MGDNARVPTRYVCPECGLSYEQISPGDARLAIRSFPRRYRQALAAVLDDDAERGLIRRRPAPATWSALEYTAHVADIMGATADAVRRMFLEDRPVIEFFVGEARAKAEGYNEQDPTAVLDRLAAGCERLAGELDRIDHDAWDRAASFPWGERDLWTTARNAVHEGSHHLRDVHRVLDAARRARG